MLAERGVAAEDRAEIESLLRFDSDSGETLTRRVREVAEEAREWGHGPASRYCGAYRLTRLLGSGGMGAVYLAERRDGEIEQKVAIKLLRADADRPSWRERFLRERQLLAYLSHASIAHLLDAGHTRDGQPYLVMEYVDGVPIDDYATALDLRATLKLFLLVCEGVAHAHQRLIIHRDLKPSNILVDSKGQPKLLDFGIAKLLDVTTREARTVERLHTPDYASPEQLSGDVQTTATDIYSLGAVLYKLVTGRSPRELSLPTATMGPVSGEQFLAPSRLNPAMPRDIDHILRKALRDEPQKRYGTVDAFADDVRAFLESRPVEARSSGGWYRARRFVARNRMAVAATAMTAAGLLVGLSLAHHQREVSKARFLQVRQLANKVLALEEVADGLHGRSSAMHEIAAMSKEHLEALGAEARRDQDLALEVVDAHWFLARSQGISAASLPEQRTRAGESLQKASILVQPILSAQPDNRKALLTGAKISHDRMILAANDRRNGEVAAEAQETVRRLERLLELGGLPAADSDKVSELFYDVALTYKNLHFAEDGIRYARRSIETARLPLRLSLGQSMLADLLRMTGDLDGALAAIRSARANLEQARFAGERERRAAWCRVLGREAKILGVPGAISLNRPDAAIAVLRQVFDLLEQWAEADREDAWSRLLFASVGRELGDTVRLRDPRRALAVYDHALMRLREVKDNPESLRGEVELLAGSAYALRELGRVSEAKGRIDAAVRALAETGDYPAEQIVLHEGADAAMRALGDHLAATGRPGEAAAVYEELLGKVLASQPEPENDLRHAVGMSHIYGSLAALHGRGKSFATLRMALWEHWDRKLPHNEFVKRQIQAARRNSGLRIFSFHLASKTIAGKKEGIRETNDHNLQLTEPDPRRRDGHGASADRSGIGQTDSTAVRAGQSRSSGQQQGVSEGLRGGNAELYLPPYRVDIHRAASDAVSSLPVLR